MKNIIEFLKRHAVWICIIALSLWGLIAEFNTVINVSLFATLGVGLNIALSNLSLYSYTKINPHAESDNDFENERAAKIDFAGRIYNSNAIIISIIIGLIAFLKAN